MNILNKYFDQIYCINLDRRPDRWAKISAQFQQLDITAKRISAFDSWALAESKGTPKQRGRYACTESHLAAIKDAVNNSYNRILIFEDDCVFSDNFNEEILAYLDKLPDDWEMLLLGYYPGPNFNLNQYKKEKIIKLSTNNTKLDGLWAAHAYGLSKNIFQRILATKNGAFSETPHEDTGEGYGCIDITYYYAFHGKCKGYAFNPPLVMQDKLDTDIDVKSKETQLY